MPALKAAAELSAITLMIDFYLIKPLMWWMKLVLIKILLTASKRKKMIAVTEIEKIVAKIARIPVKKVSARDKDTLRNLERDLKIMVFGQDRCDYCFGFCN